ncbi:MAG TPA: regulatory protein RecX [Candidatus Fimimorpha faecalis]|uniref:Regulatory protein RecX n=1 Tax=Candidatus Fimimorpha faecalis TaxID=2840824 RepID=A0A9D1JCP3_9FIRM|nr:regulatory protein RecX [Candidatus Fimimorpha faecalis]
MPRLTGNETAEELEKKAKQQAMLLLQRMDRTEAELRQKLKEKGYPVQAQDCAVNYVKAYHYIDDERYANYYIEKNQKKKGRRLIQMELEKKGIDPLVIESCMSRIENTELTAVMELIEKRTKGKLPQDEKEKQKLYAYCVRRGFSFHVVKSAMQDWNETVEVTQENV